MILYSDNILNRVFSLQNIPLFWWFDEVRLVPLELYFSSSFLYFSCRFHVSTPYCFRLYDLNSPLVRCQRLPECLLSSIYILCIKLHILVVVNLNYTKIQCENIFFYLYLTPLPSFFRQNREIAERLVKQRR